jgi:thiopeptide-type bacteriocin biosynthesis protein
VTSRYSHHDLVLLRTTTDPGDLDILPDLDLSEPGAVHGEGQDWLAKLWARDDAREAISLASPDLATHIRHLTDRNAPTADTRDLRRAILSAVGYVARWQRRVTPFGLFAGVMPARTGRASFRFGTAHRAVARPDGGWIAALAETLERDSELRPRLTVTANSLAVARDGRLIVSRRTAPGAHSPGPVLEASARSTRAVLAAMEAAAEPVLFTDLTLTLARQFPAATSEKIRSLLDVLVDEGFLITSLGPPTTASDPLAYLAEALRRAGAAGLPGTAPVLSSLDGVAELLDAHNSCADPPEAAEFRSAAVTRMAALCPAVRHPLAVDVWLDGDVTLPVQVLDEAASAASALLRMTTRPFGSPAWMDYQMRFRERYGPGALVPVRDLVADSGLGYPDGYLGAPRQRPAWRTLTERDAALLALIQQTALSGTGEIRLSDADVQSLTTGDHADVTLPPRIEIGVTLSAESADALSRGRFDLRVVAAPRVPTSMAGRFAHILPDSDRDVLAATWQTGPDEGEVLAVQLSFPPRMPHSDNVVRVAPLVPDVLPLGEHPAAGNAIRIDDLAVTADAVQMYLVHRPTERRVSAFIPHALDLPRHTPPLARFIAEVADARSAGFGPFDLGAARVLPYVPRIRYRRTILSPARWLLSRDDLRPEPGDPAGWEQSLARWRDRWHVPSRVVACHGELRLPLDLDHVLDRSLLRAQIERAERIEVREDAPSEDSGWLGRPAELLIPLTLASPPLRLLPVMAPPAATCQPGRSALVRASITGSPARFDDIIASHLPALMARLSPITVRWWVRRYRDLIHLATPQRVDLYLRLSRPAEFGEAAAELGALTADLEALGLPGQLALASCAEHPARYGHGDAMTAAEEVFAADTTAAIAQITMAAVGTPGQALAAASMARLAAVFAPDPASGYWALTRCLEQGSGRLDRTIRDQACQLADPAGDFHALRAHPGGGDVVVAWRRRDAALANYHETLATQRDPATVLRTLLHEHHMRALGLDPEIERQTCRLARAAAMRRLALAKQS